MNFENQTYFARAHSNGHLVHAESLLKEPLYPKGTSNLEELYMWGACCVDPHAEDDATNEYPDPFKCSPALVPAYDFSVYRDNFSKHVYVRTCIFMALLFNPNADMRPPYSYSM